MTISSALPLQAAPPPKPPPPQAARTAPLSANEALGPRPEAPPDGRASAAAASDQPNNLPNPSIRMDPALGIVVLEFRDQKGAVRSIPTERELEAYRMAAATRRERAEAGPSAPPPTE